MPKKRAHISKARNRSPAKDDIDPNATTVDRFVRLVDDHDYVARGPNVLMPLYNMTFWAGAGFAKAWQFESPIGNTLFRIDSASIEDVISLPTLARLIGLNDLSGRIEPSQLEKIVYFLDMNEKYPEVRGRYFDSQNIELARKAFRTAVFRQFENICGLNYLDKTTLKFPMPPLTKDQQAILDFFWYLNRQSSGSMGLAEGVRIHFLTTNYDFVIETILDGLCGPDESTFLYAYRGFTPTIVAERPNIQPVHDHMLVQHLIKLNGGFEIERANGTYALNYFARSRDQAARNPPVIMLPSREQDYTDPYFRTVFPKAVKLMRDSNALVIVGYSFPVHDALIRFIMRQFAEEAEDGMGKHIFYIDFLDDAAKFERIRDIFPSINDRRLRLPHVHLYRGGFAEFASACVKSWHRNHRRVARTSTEGRSGNK